MTNEKDLVPLKGELVPSDHDINTTLHDAFTKMAGLMQVAATSLQFQSVQDAERASLTAQAVYDSSRQHGSKYDHLLLSILKDVVCLFAPLTRVMVYQTEGRFAKAREELAKGISTTESALTALAKYMRLPNAIEEIQVYKPMLSLFVILFRGLDASIQAEVFGYKGQISQYKRGLLEAVTEFRRVRELPSSLNPMILGLVGLCSGLADRLETRAEVFTEDQGQRYLLPIGDRVFIIHGHNEAKWRELRDLLEDELDLEAAVLQEEPGVGETLIGKFEECADDCRYAFALLTPDDFIEKEGISYFQARPNVLFELGWFFGHFGRERVCIVKKAKTEIPSDLAGILTINFQEDVSEVHTKIKAELQRVGVLSGGPRKRKSSTPARKRRR